MVRERESRVKKKTGRRSTQDREKEQMARDRDTASWIPKTSVGRMVQKGELTSLEELFEKGYALMEPEIVDVLLPNIEEKVVDFRKTARVNMQGRNFSFRAAVLVGDRNGHVGVGVAKDKERWPAIRKASRNAKLAIGSVQRGCGSWECACKTSHSVPFKVVGKCASVHVTLLPAPNGVGLVVGHNIRDVLELAGVQDVWSQSSGSTDTKLNFSIAAVNALHQTTEFKASKELAQKRTHSMQFEVKGVE